MIYAEGGGHTEDCGVTDEFIRVWSIQKVGQLELGGELSSDRRSHFDLGVLVKQALVLKRPSKSTSTCVWDSIGWDGTSKLYNEVSRLGCVVVSEIAMRAMMRVYFGAKFR